ncbi:MAG: methylmalonyl Co-A mutase-associated GTPase MeaB [Proteobacteria bacterium]|nr:methylmalonyl Co-A mutase-associated GTPase MeaB [Desulfobulbaceae bacterium]MBU4152698.1 methylmalonyl Co-A mutase-associated GTPase MeaB [Pseudomonadota bacterium]
MLVTPDTLLDGIAQGDQRSIARAISLIENHAPQADAILAGLDSAALDQVLVLGITGPPGAGKSTLTNRLISHFLGRGERIGVIAVDPTSSISGGALLGDRIRMMEHAVNPKVIVRSMATRGRLGGLCSATGGVARVMAAAGCRLVIIETVGVGQAEMDIVSLADLTLLVLAPGLGDDIQAMKAGLLEVADILVVNKMDLPGAEALALDLEMAARTRGVGRRSSVVIAISATENQGIAELGEAIGHKAQGLCQSGEQEKRRRSAMQTEVVDWALELLRPRLAKAVQAGEDLSFGDPRQRARELLLRMGFID